MYCRAQYVIIDKTLLPITFYNRRAWVKMFSGLCCYCYLLSRAEPTSKILWMMGRYSDEQKLPHAMPQRWVVVLDLILFFWKRCSRGEQTTNNAAALFYTKCTSFIFHITIFLWFHWWDLLPTFCWIVDSSHDQF